MALAESSSFRRSSRSQRIKGTSVVRTRFVQRTLSVRSDFLGERNDEMKRGALVLAAALTACGGDSDPPEFSQRPATTGECASGGAVLLVDGEPQAVVCNGQDGQDGSATMPNLISESVMCLSGSTAPASFRGIVYSYARLYDGSLFVSVSCDTLYDQDASTELYHPNQVGVTTGVMSCALTDEGGSVIRIVFTSDFSTRRLQVTENDVLVSEFDFDVHCMVTE